VIARFVRGERDLRLKSAEKLMAELGFEVTTPADRKKRGNK
jgi:hypothetical protein